jgi:acyl dehydratase
MSGGTAVGDDLPELVFPLPVHRLVTAAGVTRDLSPIHHNDEFARRSGAPAMYASALLLLGMWERVLRDLTGPAGEILAIRGLKMVRFVPAGSAVRVLGRVVGREERDGRTVLHVELRSLVEDVLCVGPGLAEVALAEDRG